MPSREVTCGSRDSWCFSRVELARPVEAGDEEADGILAQRIGRGGLPDGDRENAGPTLGPLKRAVAESLFRPFDLETIGRSANDARHLDRNRALADGLERIALPREIVER